MTVIAERVVERSTVEPEVLRLSLAHGVEQLEAGNVGVAPRAHQRNLAVEQFLLGVQHL